MNVLLHDEVELPHEHGEAGQGDQGQHRAGQRGAPHRVLGTWNMECRMQSVCFYCQIVIHCPALFSHNLCNKETANKMMSRLEKTMMGG